MLRRSLRLPQRRLPLRDADLLGEEGLYTGRGRERARFAGHARPPAARVITRCFQTPLMTVVGRASRGQRGIQQQHLGGALRLVQMGRLLPFLM